MDPDPLLRSPFKKIPLGSMFTVAGYRSVPMMYSQEADMHAITNYLVPDKDLVSKGLISKMPTTISTTFIITAHFLLSHTW